MFAWLVDNASIVYVLLGCAGLALAVGWWMNRSRGLLIGLLVVAGLVALLFLLTVLVVTDRQQITGMIREMASAVPSRQPDRIVKHLSRDFEFQGVRKPAAAEYVASLIKRHALQDVYVWEFDVEKLSREEGKATVTFLARVDMPGEGTHVFRLRADCVLEDGRWRVKGFRIYNPVVNNDQPFQIP